jgi:hypothetical protein
MKENASASPQPQNSLPEAYKPVSFVISEGVSESKETTSMDLQKLDALNNLEILSQNLIKIIEVTA